MRFNKRLVCLTLLIFFCSGYFIALPGLSATFTDVSADGHLDLGKLDAAEKPVQALADQMLELSGALQSFDTHRAAIFFTDPCLMTTMPSRPTELTTGVKWVQRHGWSIAKGETREILKEDLISTWDDFLAHYSEIEDVRIEVVGAFFDGPSASGKADLKFYLIGRDPNRLREWTQGNASVSLKFVEAKGWLIQAFTLTHLESLVASTELFTEVSESSGVSLSLPLLGEKNSRPYSFYWHGAAATDIDMDGDVDLFVTSDYRNYLYLNDGTGKFSEQSQQASLMQTSDPSTAGGTAPLFVDIDNDGDKDLFLSMWDKQKLFENRLVPDGKIEFQDISEEAGVAVVTNGLTAISGDINNDGLPDIYVCGYGRLDHPETGLTAFYGPENGGRNLLFVNQGNRRFSEMAKEYGVDDRNWSQAAVFFDFDENGYQDLYVTNDWGNNSLYLNDGTRFRNASTESGLTKAGFGMGVSLGDYDNDGDIDIHATYMSSTAGERILGIVSQTASLEKYENTWQELLGGNRIYENQGGSVFSDVSEIAGPFRAQWAWGGGFVDFDNDGWQDIHSPNGLWSGKHKKET